MNSAYSQFLQGESSRGIHRDLLGPARTAANVALGMQANSALRIRDVQRRPAGPDTHMTSILFSRAPKVGAQWESSGDTLTFSMRRYKIYSDTDAMTRLLEEIHVDTGSWAELMDFWPKVESGISMKINLTKSTMKELTRGEIHKEESIRQAAGVAWTRRHDHADDEIFVYAKITHRLEAV